MPNVPRRLALALCRGISVTINKIYNIIVVLVNKLIKYIIYIITSKNLK